ncbi:NAD-dependent epimerase/dehydratase family protein [Pseudonocardia spinosispora]|uniref:NAD-dependent epimerase/dehydratase family protein n=1 Tax=Pseudonocardia spinosispora TaxID=103441 RepID=UPI0004294495|nr:NAD-dependent epimerase/dehydratase family protein [Pseudonocardia spinosispora]
MLLITGATGYLGTVLATLLRDQGFEVRAAVRNADRARLLPEGVEWAIADLDDPDSLRRAADGCSGVFHLAASIGESLEQTRELNVEGTRAVLRAARDAGVRRFVHTSTSAAIIDPTGLVAEDAPGGTALVDPYSTTKAEAEQLVLAESGDGMDVMVMNPVSIYGPSPSGPHSYNGLLASAAEGKVEAVVDAAIGWVLASDVALGHLLAYRHGENGRRYVLCGGVARFGAVLHRYAELVGSPHRVRVLPPGSSLGADAPTFARRSEVYGKLAPVRVSDERARGLGFSPVGVEEGLALTAAWLPSTG